MLLGGDEIKRSQNGNNNAYNQDNATSWFDWTLVESNGEMLRFDRRMVGFRKAHPALWQPSFYVFAINERGLPDISWHGAILDSPGFDDPQARAVACTIAGFDGHPDLHVMMNMFWEPLDFAKCPPVGPGRPRSTRSRGESTRHCRSRYGNAAGLLDRCTVQGAGARRRPQEWEIGDVIPSMLVVPPSPPDRFRGVPHAV